MSQIFWRYIDWFEKNKERPFLNRLTTVTKLESYNFSLYMIFDFRFGSTFSFSPVIKYWLFKLKYINRLTYNSRNYVSTPSGHKTMASLIRSDWLKLKRVDWSLYRLARLIVCNKHLRRGTDESRLNIFCWLRNTRLQCLRMQLISARVHWSLR